MFVIYYSISCVCCFLRFVIFQMENRKNGGWRPDGSSSNEEDDFKPSTTSRKRKKAKAKVNGHSYE
jgi:hypothetical protein